MSLAPVDPHAPVRVHPALLTPLERGRRARPERVGRYSPAGEAAKEVGDRLLAAVGLMLLSPLLVVMGLAVCLDSPGPACFRQPRVGRGGRLFLLWKFRGMYVDAHERFPQLYNYSLPVEVVRERPFHPPADPRVTRLGHLLRRTSLDELPNLLNVVRGEMSLVGPRPEIPELLPYYGEAAAEVLSVKPGITSLAKASGRDELTFAETLELDRRYVRDRCLRLDLRLLVQTVIKIALGRCVGH